MKKQASKTAVEESIIPTTGTLFYLPVSEVGVIDDNPSRFKTWDELPIDDLLTDLRNGTPIRTPVIVAEIDNGKGVTTRKLVAGRRRVKAIGVFNDEQTQAAAEYAKWEKGGKKGSAPKKPKAQVLVPVLRAADITTEADYVLAASQENLHREDVTSADQIVIAQRMRDQGMTQPKIAEQFGKTTAHVSKLLKAGSLGDVFIALMDRPNGQALSVDAAVKVAQAVEKGKLSKGEAQAVATLFEAGKLSNEQIKSGTFSLPSEDGKGKGEKTTKGKSANASMHPQEPYTLRTMAQLHDVLAQPAWESDEFAHVSGLVECLRTFIEKPTAEGKDPGLAEAKRTLIDGLYKYSRKPGVRPGKLTKPVPVFESTAKQLEASAEEKANAERDADEQ